MTETSNLNIDDEMKKIGEFGPYQLLIFVLVGLTACIPATIVYGYVFVRCQIPNFNNDTFQIQSDYHETLINYYIPKISDDTKVYDKCHLKVYGNQSVTNTSLDYTKEKCKSWVYSDSIYKKTIVTDWNLVCDNASKKSAFSSIFFMGSYGVLVVGLVSDRFGRKLCAYILLIMNLILNALIAIIVNVDMNQSAKEMLFSILRFLTAISSNIYSVATVLAVEITGPKYRVTASNVLYYFYILGEYVVVLLCYFVRDYDKFYIWLTCLFICFPLYFWIIPESPRWLVQKNRTPEAYVTLKRIARSNKRPIPETYDAFVLEQQKNVQKQTVCNNIKVVQIGFLRTLYAFVKSKSLLLRTVALTFNWFTNNLVYYGLTLGTGQLAGDPYLNFTLFATVELIAIVSTEYAYKRFGRKIPYIINMTVAGAILLVVYFVPKSMTTIIIAIALIGKFCSSFTFGGIYVMTSELYPTVIRQTAFSMCSIIAKLGAIISPYINLLGELYYQPLPFMIYGACATLAAVLTFFFVPETNNCQLPNNIADTD